MSTDTINRDDIAYRKKLIEKYRPIAERLNTYLSWLDSKRGVDTSQTFTGQGIGEHSITFPVYDSTLMALVKLLQNSELMDRNYVYVYSRNRLKTHEDEIRLIHNSELKDVDNIRAILSKYVMEGMRRGTQWTEAVTSGIFYECIAQLKKDIEFWDVPIN